MHRYTGFNGSIEDLRRSFLASSILDALLCSTPASRYHWFFPDHLPGLDIGYLDHGSGDDLRCFMSVQHGCLIKGFDHESPMSPHAQDEFQTWPGIFDEAPTELLSFLEEPEMNRVETTFCIWRGKTDVHWWQGDITEPDNGEWSENLLKQICLDGRSYFDWAREYFSRKVVSEEIVHKVYDTHRVELADVARMNPTADVAKVRLELSAMNVMIEGS